MVEIVVGRDESDLKKYGEEGTILLGKHIVGTGEEVHLTTNLLLDVLRPHVIVLTGKRGEGKCLDGGTLITLDNGNCIPIRDLENDTNNVISLNDNFKIIRSGKTGFYKRTVKELLRIKLRSGKEIKLTPEHPLFTMNGWKPTQELKIGSRIATPRRIDIFGDLDLPKYKVKLLAYLIAEGHVRRHGKMRLARFTNADEIIINEFEESVRKFDTNLVVSKYGKYTYGIIDKRRHITTISERDRAGRIISSRKQSIGNSVITWLEEIGAYGELSKNKIIPEIVFRFNEENLKTFLNRLFSCDGSIYKREGQYEISYSTSSKSMAKQIQHLLLRFGIPSKLKEKILTYNKKRFEACEILIRGGFVNIFLNEIGFYGKKEERQKEAVMQKIVRNPNTDTIPKEIWDTYRPRNWSVVGRHFGYAYPKTMRESARYSPSREKLLQIAKIENNEGLRLLAESDIFWDEIVFMELLEGEFEVYDISVPEHHNFVANDIIVHNSYSMGVIVEELMKVPQHLRKNLCSLVIDTQGIFWTMKSPNEKEYAGLGEWNLPPRGFNVFVTIPEGQTDSFISAGVEFDGTFSVSPAQLTSEDWLSIFGIGANEPLGILLQKAFRKLRDRENYHIDDIIAALQKEEGFESEKMALQNRFAAAKEWGIFGEEKMPVILEGGRTTIIDVSLTPQNVRSLLVSIVCKKILEERVKARRREEAAETSLSATNRKPMPWIFIDEAHNFFPNAEKTVASDVLGRLVREGRQPGITMIFATQQPERLSQEALSQSDMVISFRLTAKGDVDALKAIMQTYLLYDIGRYINELPKVKGAGIILDDNSERIYKVRIRPRQSWHAGSSPVAI